jgi:hypothetical protein
MLIIEVGVPAFCLRLERFTANADIAAGIPICDVTRLLRFSCPIHQLQLY